MPPSEYPIGTLPTGTLVQVRDSNLGKPPIGVGVIKAYRVIDPGMYLSGVRYDVDINGTLLTDLSPYRLSKLP